jgi:hypothetical protein
MAVPPHLVFIPPRESEALCVAIRRGILPGLFHRENADQPAERDVPAKNKIAVAVHWRI